MAVLTLLILFAISSETELITFEIEESCGMLRSSTPEFAINGVESTFAPWTVSIGYYEDVSKSLQFI